MVGSSDKFISEESSISEDESDDFVENEEETVPSKRTASGKSKKSKKSLSVKKTPTKKINKENPKITNKSDAISILTNYILGTNKPYTLIVLYENLHREFSKKELTVALSKLVEDSTLCCKEFGKTILWWANQNTLETKITDKDPEIIKKELENLKHEQKELNDQIGQIRNKINKLENKKSVKELESLLSSVRAAIEQNKSLIENEEKEGKTFDAEDFEKRKKIFIEVVKKLKQRSRISNEMVDLIGGELKTEKNYKKLELDQDSEEIKKIVSFMNSLK